jgi:hypothetical protein
LPLISLQYNEVKINIELSDLRKSLNITPDHYIEIADNPIVLFKPFEYIEQNLDNVINSGIFCYYDSDTRRLYYRKTSKNNFQANPNPTSISLRQNRVNTTNMNYQIYGTTSKTFLTPKPLTTAKTNPGINLFNDNTFHINKCYLLINYVYLDADERSKIMQAKHNYLIEQVERISAQPINTPNNLVNIGLTQPCKFLVWMVQYTYIKNLNDAFNYTNSYKYSLLNQGGKLIGKSIVKEETLLLNNTERISNREYQYFNYIQPYQLFPYPVNEGINVYSFSLSPHLLQPSGSCNMSQIDNIQIRLSLSSDINPNNTAIFSGYALVYNILRIVNGLSGLVFDYNN